MNGTIRAWLKRVPGLSRLALMYHAPIIAAERDRLKALLATLHSDPVEAIRLFPKSTWLWGGLESRRAVQEQGYNLVPTDFYSNTPSIADIESSFEYADPELRVPPYDLGLDDAAMQAELQSLMPHAAEFTPPTADPGDGGYFWDNGLFGASDAMAYYCYLRKLKPRTVLEIGSGFSSLAALAGLKANGSGRLVCIEPYPRDFLKGRADITLVQEPAQRLKAEYFNDILADGDVLFIDSTHTVKTGSDCLHIYLRLLPKLRRRLHVHVHDIYLPFGMPKNDLLERQIHWTEQYLLLAFLLDNPKARVLYGSRYHAWCNPQMLELFMAGKAPIGGGSFWFEYRGA
jgi:hypothetical protein